MHDDDKGHDRIQAAVRVLRLIVSGLLVGVLVFAGIVLFALEPPDWRDGTPILSYVAFGVAIHNVVLWSFVPGLIAGKQVTRIADGTWHPGRHVPAASFPDDTSRLLAVYQTTSIIGWALLESIAFLGLIAYLVERETFSIGIAAGAALLMLLTFPSESKLREWLDAKRQRILERREMGGGFR